LNQIRAASGILPGVTLAETRYYPTSARCELREKHGALASVNRT
jgi:hypothetical protein